MQNVIIILNLLCKKYTESKMFRKNYRNIIYVYYFLKLMVLLRIRLCSFLYTSKDFEYMNKFYYTKIEKLTKAEEKIFENREQIIKNEKKILKDLNLKILNIMKKEYLLLNKNKKENEEIQKVPLKIIMTKVIKYLKRSNNMFKIMLILQNKLFILFKVSDDRINTWRYYDPIILKNIYNFIWYELITINNLDNEFDKYSSYHLIYKYEFEFLILNEFSKYILKLKLYKIDKVIHFN